MNNILFTISLLLFWSPHMRASDSEGGKKSIPNQQITNATDHFRSKQSGNWNEHTTWESSPDNITWSPATASPSAEAKTTTIENGHIVNITSTESAGALIVKQGAVLEHAAGFNFHIMPAKAQPSSISFEIHGLLILNGRSPVLPSGISAKVFSGGMVRVDGNNNSSPGATFPLSEVFGYSNQVFWDTNAIFEWNTTEAFRLSGSTFYFPNAGPDDIAIFRINKDLINPGTGSNGVNGLLEVNRTITLGSGTTNVDKTFRDGICGSGKLIAGSPAVRFRIDGSSPALGGAGLEIHSERKINLTTDVTIPEDSIVIITGEGINNNLPGQKLMINGILDMTDQQFTNANGIIEVSSAGILRTSRNQGFSGTSTTIPSGNIILSTGSTIDFYGNEQTVTNRPDYKNIIISGAGIKTPAGTFSPNGTITIKEDAIFDCSYNNIGNANTNLTMEGGRLILGTNGLQPAMAGTYNLVEGVVEFANSNPGQSGQTIRTETYKHIVITGNNVANSSGRIQIRPGGTFVIMKNGVYNSSSGNAPVIATPSEGSDSNHTLRIEQGGTFRTNVTGGFYGKMTTGQTNSYPSVDYSINNIELAPESTIEYSRHQNDEQQISYNDRFIYQNILLSGSGEKIMPENISLEIKGNFTCTENALFKSNKSTVLFRGAGTQTISSDGHELEFYNLVIDNGSAINPDNKLFIGSSEGTEDVAVTNFLTLKEDSGLELNTADLVIKSTIENTARVGPIPASAIITYSELPGANGRFRVERYINDHFKAWQLLAPNASNGSTFESWQNNRINTPGRGIQITSPDYSTTNGFDMYSPSPSMKYWDIEAQSYIGVNSTLDKISDHPGYMIFIRGDRSVTSIDDDNHPATTIHTIGKLYTPATPPPSVIVPSEKFAIVGNPYASAIDYSKLNISDLMASDEEHPLSKGYYIWNPRIEQGRSQYLFGNGVFQRVQFIAGFGASPVPSPIDNDTTGSTIQSGQAIFVYNSGNKGIIQFSESAKVEGSNNEFFRPSDQEGKKLPSLIRTNLAAMNGGAFILDGTLQIFGSEYSQNIDESDARKMTNDGENLWLSSDAYPLIVESRPWPQDDDTIFYSLSKLKRQAYTLQFGMNGINSQKIEVALNDAYTKDVIILKDGTNYYDFKVDEQEASYHQNRFFLTFHNYRVISPHFYFANENAEKNEGFVIFTWGGFNQVGVEEYIIEHSVNKSDFRSISIVQPSEDPDGDYYFKDDKPSEGINYYRVKATSPDGEPVYSKTVVANILPSEASTTIYPNPVRTFIKIEMNHHPEGKYELRVTDATGRVVHLQTVVINSNRSNFRIPAANLGRGVYQLEIVAENGNRETKRIVIGH